MAAQPTGDGSTTLPGMECFRLGIDSRNKMGRKKDAKGHVAPKETLMDMTLLLWDPQHSKQLLTAAADSSC